MTNCTVDILFGEVTADQMFPALAEPEGLPLIHKSPSLKPILSHLNQLHNSKFCFSKLDFNIILPSMIKSNKVSIYVFWT
jgi:hypothetical protein